MMCANKEVQIVLGLILYSPYLYIICERL
jgi:hypothetical protein